MEIANIKESELPSIINEQIEKYKELEKSIKESVESAEEAKKTLILLVTNLLDFLIEKMQ